MMLNIHLQHIKDILALGVSRQRNPDTLIISQIESLFRRIRLTYLYLLKKGIIQGVVHLTFFTGHLLKEIFQITVSPKQLLRKLKHANMSYIDFCHCLRNTVFFYNVF